MKKRFAIFPKEPNSPEVIILFSRIKRKVTKEIMKITIDAENMISFFSLFLLIQL